MQEGNMGVQKNHPLRQRWADGGDVVFGERARVFRIDTPHQRRPGCHALGARGCEASAHKRDQLLDAKAVREHDRLGAAVGCSEQLKRTPAVGFSAAVSG
jgi:hypothetical protein